MGLEVEGERNVKRRRWHYDLYLFRFIAILLVVFGLTAEQAFDEFIDLSVDVLDKNGLDAEARTAALSAYTQDLLEKHGFQKDVHLLDQNLRAKGCKLYGIHPLLGRLFTDSP